MPTWHWTNIIIAGLVLLADGVFASDTRWRADDPGLIAGDAVEISPHTANDPAGPDSQTLDTIDTAVLERNGYVLKPLAQTSDLPLHSHHYRSSRPRAPPVPAR